MAYRQVVEYGMSPTIGHISLPHKRPSEPARRMYNDKLARMIDEVMDILYIVLVGHVRGRKLHEFENWVAACDSSLNFSVLIHC